MRALFDSVVTQRIQVGVLYWTYNADAYQSDPKFAVRALVYAHPHHQRPRIASGSAARWHPSWHSPIHSPPLPPFPQAMRAERGYDYEDTCTVSPEKMPNYEEKIKSFYEEHIHSDEVRVSAGAFGAGCAHG